MGSGSPRLRVADHDDPGAVRTQPTLFEMSGRRPEELAIEDGTRRRTWGELEHRTRAVAHGLSQQAPEGSHVALIASNRVEFLEVALACLRVGLVYTPLKSSWTPTEIGAVLSDASTRLVVTDVPAGRQAGGDFELPVIDLDQEFDAWVARQADEPLAYELAGRKMTYTSGTTGRPKGVVPNYLGRRPFAESFAGSAAMAELTGLPGHGVHLFVSHLFHGAPLTFGIGALARGATIRIVPRWNPETVLAMLSDRVTSTSMVPTMFRQLLQLPTALRAAFDAPQLVTILHGGEACPVPVKQAMLDWWGPRLTEYYGFSEGGMTLATSEEWMERPGTVGRPARNQRLLIINEEGEEVGPGIDGTIYVATADGVTFSYLNDEAKTATAHRDGAFTVGDIGHLDDQGYLFITGRKSDVIVSAGVNIYPVEIESTLSDTDGVADLAIVSAPDDIRGEQVAAVVVLRPGADASDVVAQVARTAAEQLAGYKRPRLYFQVPGLPRDPTGKLLRTSLRDLVSEWSTSPDGSALVLVPTAPSTASQALAPIRKGKAQ
jgi:long-chain acyl-CoA synthetase